MANNNDDKNKEKENEYFLDANEDEIDIEDVNYYDDNSNNNDDDNDDDRNATYQPQSFTYQQLPQSYTYAISYIYVTYFRAN